MWGVRSRSGDKKQLLTGPRATRRPGTMKTVDVSKFTVVKAGVPCQSETPIKLEWLVKLMERNEEYIYWLQPAGGGVDDQFPCVCINNKYYMLNLKLEKAIFRHVRLCRDFNNSELLEDGTRKLRIPRRLLREKLKTSCRFQVSAIDCDLVLCVLQCDPIHIHVTAHYLHMHVMNRAWPLSPLAAS